MYTYVVDDCAVIRGKPVIHCFGGEALVDVIEPDINFVSCNGIEICGDRIEALRDGTVVPFTYLTPEQAQEEARKKPVIMRVM